MRSYRQAQGHLDGAMRAKVEAVKKGMKEVLETKMNLEWFEFSKRGDWVWDERSRTTGPGCSFGRLSSGELRLSTTRCFHTQPYFFFNNPSFVYMLIHIKHLVVEYNLAAVIREEQTVHTALNVREILMITFSWLLCSYLPGARRLTSWNSSREFRRPQRFYNTRLLSFL